ncbi:MAG: Mut7-C RNAse domain-containing protein [Gammaproteobacteria bacterium]|nr:MAG: Mut7-C RNAse domain-containing protein [Gammaproteobacteria bacterium]
MTCPISTHCSVPDGGQPAFLCDEMLKGLGHWLRAAGYDTNIAPDGANDRELIRSAIDEHRCLITRDKKLLEHRHASEVVLLLQGNTLDECAQELTQRLRLNWLYHPFSRCLLCNTPLITADPALWVRVPAESRAHNDVLYICKPCNKLYWTGGHVRRMRARLEHWQ